MKFKLLMKNYRRLILNKKKERAWLLELNAYIRDKMRNAEIERVCPLCGETSAAFAFQAPICRFTRCNRCGLVYAKNSLNEKALADFYKHDTWFQDIYQKELENYREMKQQGMPMSPEAKRILAYSHGRDKCLDIGSGYGTLLYQLKPYFRSVEGVEPNSYISKVGAELYEVVIHNGQLSDTPLEDGSYDCIILSQVIEHLFSFDELFLRISRLLKPGGIIYIGCPSLSSLSMKLLGGDHIHVYSIGHINMFDRPAMDYLAHKYSLKVRLNTTDDLLDLDMNDLIYYYCKRKSFVHRDNLIPFLNLPNTALSVALGYLLRKTECLSRRHLGSYIVAILEK